MVDQVLGSSRAKFVGGSQEVARATGLQIEFVCSGKACFESQAYMHENQLSVLTHFLELYRIWLVTNSGIHFIFSAQTTVETKLRVFVCFIGLCLP